MLFKLLMGTLGFKVNAKDSGDVNKQKESYSFCRCFYPKLYIAFVV